MPPTIRWFTDALVRYPRVAIVGAPRTGKSTLLSGVVDRPTYGSDELNATGVSWEEAPAALIAKAAELGPRWVMEGVQLARALRKGLVADAVVLMGRPKVVQTFGQATMGKGIMTVLGDWRRTIGQDVPLIHEDEG